jgi:hypothetical protein
MTEGGAGGIDHVIDVSYYSTASRDKEVDGRSLRASSWDVFAGVNGSGSGRALKN